MSTATRHLKGYDVARAVDGPADTIVVDLLHWQGKLEPELIRRRRLAMADDPALGAKTIGVVACDGPDVELLFLQGLGEDIDAASEVCLNSATAALTVARERWATVPDGVLRVHMGGLSFELEQVA